MFKVPPEVAQTWKFLPPKEWGNKSHRVHTTEYDTAMSIHGLQLHAQYA